MNLFSLFSTLASDYETCFLSKFPSDFSSEKFFFFFFGCCTAHTQTQLTVRARTNVRSCSQKLSTLVRTYGPNHCDDRRQGPTLSKQNNKKCVKPNNIRYVVLIYLTFINMMYELMYLRNKTCLLFFLLNIIIDF